MTGSTPNTNGAAGLLGEAPAGLTFGEMLTLLALRTRSADESGDAVALPADPVLRDKLTLALNRGYDRFLRADPDWTFLRFRWRLAFAPSGDGPHNIDRDPARYRLPAVATGTPVSDWSYLDETAGYESIRAYEYHRVLRLHEDGVHVGTPEIVGYHPIVTRDGPQAMRPAGVMALFWPTPGHPYTIETTFRIQTHRMTEIDEYHVAGGQHDEAILSAAEWYWYDHVVNDPRNAARAKQDYADALAQSQALDVRERPRRMGMLEDTSVRKDRIRRERTNRQYSFNGTALDSL